MIDKHRLDGLLFAIIGDATLVERWWYSPNREFDMERPIDIFVLEPEQVRDYVFRMANLNNDYL